MQGVVYCDLHVHLSASCDSDAEIWDVCERAIEVGLEAVAFSEHVELAPGDYCHNRYDYGWSKRACDTGGWTHVPTARTDAGISADTPRRRIPGSGVEGTMRTI
ncbi:MAG: PHP domain-containing protein [Bacillota bacterium]